MRSIVDRNVVLRRMTNRDVVLYYLWICYFIYHQVY